MFRRFQVLVFAILLLMGNYVTVRANDGPVKSVGKTIQPLNNVPVRMVSEEVSIHLTSNSADVRCLFTLRNEGKPDTIEVGFPRGWESDLLNFTAKNVLISAPYAVETLAQDPSYNEISGGELPWWKVFKVPFTATGQTIIVENSYCSNLVIAAGKYPTPTSDLQFTYIMKTGALWKGNIEKALMTIHIGQVPFEQITSISPEGYDREGNSIIWRFRDFKPSKNIEITIMQDVLFERMEIARRILKTEPKNAYAHYLLGSVYFSRRNVDETQIDRAAEEARKAIAVDPKLWDAHWLLTMTYINKNVFKEKNLKEVTHLLDPILRGNPGYRPADKLIRYDEYAQEETPGALLHFLESNNWK